MPADFAPPRRFETPVFRLEPLGPEHNERDFEAWSSSMEHIRATPGFDRSWPHEMTLDENRADLERHARDFEERTGFTYTVLDGDKVVGCVYIYPLDGVERGARVRSWVREPRGAGRAAVALGPHLARHGLAVRPDRVPVTRRLTDSSTAARSRHGLDLHVARPLDVQPRGARADERVDRRLDDHEVISCRYTNC